MKKTTKIFSIILLTVLSLILTNVNKVHAESTNVSRDLDTEVGKIIIPFEKKWQNVPETELPSSLNIKLYKYSGDIFDESTAILVESTKVTKENSWKYNFDISSQPLFDSNNNIYKFKVVEELIPGYEEVEHQDPQVVFNPPSINEGWLRIEPCSQLDISTNGNFKTVVIAKMTGSYNNVFIVWTPNSLSESERKLIYEETRKINGFGNPQYKAYKFISGTIGEYYANGEKVLEVDEAHINFIGGKNVWSLFATGLYEKSSTETHSSYITNTIKTIDLTVEKKWDDHNNILGFRPSSVIVQLLKNEEVIAEVTLSEDNSWTHVFEKLYEYTQGEINSYTVKELNIDKYTPHITKNGNIITITNIHEVKPTEVKVSKIWKDVEQINELPGIIIVLYYKVNIEDEFREINRIILNESNNWNYTFTNGKDIITGKNFDILPENYIYEIKEIEYDLTDEIEKSFFKDFFITEYAHTGNDWTITNTCTASYILPDTGGTGKMILSLVVTFLLTTPIIYLIYTFIKKKVHKLIPIKQ